MIANSGSPYNVTLSQDLIGSSQLNQRPSFSSATPGGAIIPFRDSALSILCRVRMPRRFQLTILRRKVISRLTCAWRRHLISARKTKAERRRRWGWRRWRAWRRWTRRRANPFGGGGPGGFGGSTSTRRYSVTLSVNARNVFNNVNLANPSAVLNPPAIAGGSASYNTSFFGVSNALAGGPFSSNAANRQIYLQAGFSF